MISWNNLVITDHQTLADREQIRLPDTRPSDFGRPGANPPARWQAFKSLINYFSLPEVIPVTGPQKIEEKIFLRNNLQVAAFT